MKKGMSKGKVEVHPSEYKIFSATPSHFSVFIIVLQLCNRNLLPILAISFFFLIVF